MTKNKKTKKIWKFDRKEALLTNERINKAKSIVDNIEIANLDEEESSSR